jgi:chromosome segregation ATPase
MRRDDDVEIPSLTLDQDEVSNRRPSATAPKGHSTPTPARPAHAPSVVHKKQSLVGIYFLLILLLLVSAGAGYWLWQQNMQLRNDLYGAKSEIQNLDHQLLAADVSANEQGETLEETLKNHESEIRKLWGVSYDTNRKSIESNDAAIEELQKKLSSMRDTISTQSKRIAVQAEAFNEVEAGFNKLVPTVASIDETVKTVAAKQDAQAKQLQASEKSIAAQAGQNEAQALSLDQILQDLTALQKKVSTIEKRTADTSSTDVANIQDTLAKHQDAINSSDAFRTQVNGEIIRLRKQINQLMLEQQLSSQ